MISSIASVYLFAILRTSLGQKTSFLFINATLATVMQLLLLRFKLLILNWKLSIATVQR